jgi:UDP:flavonoid glycosyltransferase YjiC (YdhE family)
MHAGTGWFISHGRRNSVQEVLSFRVPMYVFLPSSPRI